MNKFLLIAGFTAILFFSFGCHANKKPFISEKAPPPPPKLIEFMTPPSKPHTHWVPGGWVWKGEKKGYIWVPGRWEKNKP